MPEAKLGPWLVGIDHLSPDTDLPKGAVRDALNSYFDSSGNIWRKPGRTSVLEAPRMHSLWTSRALGVSFCMQGTTLNRVQIVDGALQLTALATLRSADPVSYDDLNNEVVFGNLKSLGVISSALVVRPLGLDTPQGFLAVGDSVGGLTSGRYAVAMSFLRGNEESGLSDLQVVHLQSDGGIRLSSIPQASGISGVRIYRSGANGDQLYRAIDLPTGMTDALIGAGQLGRMADTQFLTRMNPGSIVRHWRGRLLIAKGKSLSFSEPMRFGLRSPTEGFIQEGAEITMVQPVEGGVWVSTTSEVVFYSGDSPKTWNRRRLGVKPAIPGTGSLVFSSELSGQEFLSLPNGGYVAMWLNEQGFCIGTQEGSCIQPQSKRIRVSSVGVGTLAVFDRQVIAAIL
jgi:hypothetical protein